ncbi:MAG: hypothetical protein ACHP9Y_06235, partial [Gammaproteobacteria bacterium]
NDRPEDLVGLFQFLNDAAIKVQLKLRPEKVKELLQDNVPGPEKPLLKLLFEKANTSLINQIKVWVHEVLPPMWANELLRAYAPQMTGEPSMPYQPAPAATLG